MDRLHIAFFGLTNSGKSTLVNAICGQEVSLVSAVPGTTTDPVRKIAELPGLGPCVLIDTAGIDDASLLGDARKRLTRAVMDETDLAVVLHASPDPEGLTDALLAELRDAEIPTVVYRREEGVPSLLERLAARAPREEARFLTGRLAGPERSVLLVMPQDSEAPKGRLILPQVQVLRELLDRGCVVHACTPEALAATLRSLAHAPDLVITDSQVFGFVAQTVPADCPLTSFSVLLAAAKGDVRTFVEGARAIDRLRPGDRVLIAEACTHVPNTEDIGRFKIPALLEKRIKMAEQVGHDEYKGDQAKIVMPGPTGHLLNVEVAAGNDFPEDLSPYALIIHCGACVANARLVRTRIKKALRAGVPITNYGIAIAFLQGILDRIALP